MGSRGFSSAFPAVVNRGGCRVGCLLCRWADVFVTKALVFFQVSVFLLFLAVQRSSPRTEGHRSRSEVVRSAVGWVQAPAAGRD